MVSNKFNGCYRLEGKVAVVTAASTGIGYAIAERFLHEGAKVVISSRKQSHVDDAIKKLVQDGAPKDNVAGIVCHVGIAEHRQKLLEVAMAKFGKIHILVNNAGINPTFGDIADIGEKEWDKLFEINVKAAHLLTQAAAPIIAKNGGGSIIFNASYAAYKTSNGIAAYGVTKTALIALTKAYSVSLAPNNIRVNCVAPGIIKTKLSQALWDPKSPVADQAKDEITNYMGRIGVPHEIASTVAFLVSSDASYMTGETVLVTGGVDARL
ncbi:unnamed protein product [Bursaphelenchus okinawaensis]|uniref:Dehydrogenase/reductase SDR family member 4 n=1 Tax=Bursaphelenchus okinawaensis TaxID=465554 RepID=A0A811LDT4_9BILA|nr:unnamed protein product [Bursaphelenchus okinawaensis]CAG9123405.1 unnamed protein product [Bursaphelenchus okinawaensis]